MNRNFKHNKNNKNNKGNKDNKNKNTSKQQQQQKHQRKNNNNNKKEKNNNDESNSDSYVDMSPRKRDININDIDNNSPKQQQKQQQKHQSKDQDKVFKFDITDLDLVINGWQVPFQLYNFNLFLSKFESTLQNTIACNRFLTVIKFIQHKDFDADGILFDVRGAAASFISQSKVSFGKNELLDQLDDVDLLSLLIVLQFVKNKDENTFRISITNSNNFITVFNKFFRHTSRKTNTLSKDPKEWCTITSR